jgi:antirestriction protein ArdC
MKCDEAKGLIERGVRELNEALAAGKSDRLQKFLDVMSRFPSYSFNNQILICLQAPDSTQVQGFHGWKKLGRKVKKGEKGIGIIAPMVYRKDKDASPESDEKSIRGFKVVHVFDVSQTEGDPLPEFARATGDPGDNIAAIEKLIRSQRIQLDYELIPGGADGVSRKGQIVVRPDLEPAATLMVLIHEYAHACLHQQSDRRKETTKTIRETEAEAVAYVVGQALGLQSLEQSADYIQLYNGDSQVLADSMDHIQKTAAHILEGIAAHSKQEEVAA